MADTLSGHREKFKIGAACKHADAELKQQVCVDPSLRVAPFRMTSEGDTVPVILSVSEGSIQSKNAEKFTEDNEGR